MKRNRWICGLLTGKQEYLINGVKYIVSAEFEKRDSSNTIRSRFEHAIKSEMIDLTIRPSDDIIRKEYMYSAAGKED